MILFFDTETTGLPKRNLPIVHQDQPHLVQLACILTDDEGEERASISMVVNPGIPIPKSASDIHGITDDVAMRSGVSPVMAASLFASLLGLADLLVAHNIGFDVFVMRALMARLVLRMDRQPEKRFCTLKAATPIVNLPPTERMVAAGLNVPKAPKLSECVKHFFDEDLQEAHDALVDVRACARVYFHLVGQKQQAAAA